MSDENKHGRLGRGLSALIGDAEPDFGQPANDRGRASREVPIEKLRPNPFQPRQSFSDGDLDDLAQSIREKGILQPIVVRPVPGDPQSFQIVAGERRWRAAQRAQIHQVPVVIKELNDSEALEVAIVENVQRTDLNAVEEAAGYQALMDQFDHTQEQLAQIIGKSRSHIANQLRLLTLPQGVRELIASGQLSSGHARTLVGASDPFTIAKAIIAGKMTVREAEDVARGAREKKGGKIRVKPEKDADVRGLEKALTEILGLKCEITHHPERGGEVRIHYKTLEQLDEVLALLGRTSQ